MANNECLSHEQLASFDAGLCDEGSASEIEQHLDTCNACLDTAISLSSAQNEMATAITQVSSLDVSFANDEAVQRGIERALRINHDVSPNGLGRIRDYVLESVLGQGGMGTVYLAHHERLGKRFAVKVLSDRVSSDADAMARFDREMKAIGRLEHPNIVAATDAGADDDQHYLAMEYIDGVDVGELVGVRGKLPVADAVQIAAQALEAIEYAHSRGLVHRDIKLANLMLTLDGRVKLLDLGLALLRTGEPEDTSLTDSGQVMGTVDYIAPEQITDSHDVDGRADLYSLGCVLYHMLSGEAPFAKWGGKSKFKTLRAHVDREAEPLENVDDSIPSEVVDIVKRLMSKAPDERPQHAKTVADQLAAFAEGAQLAALARAHRASPKREGQAGQSSLSMALDETANIEAVEQRQRTKSRRRLWISILSAAVLLLCGMVYINTGVAELEVEVNDPNVTISIDGARQSKVTIRRGDDRIVLQLPITAGKHEMLVTRDGFETATRSFRVFRNGKAEITARLKPIKQAAFTGHEKPVRRLLLTAKQSTLVSAGDDGIVRFWSFPDGNQQQLIQAHNAQIRAAELSPDGKSLFTASKDQSIKQWDRATGKLQLQYAGHSAEVRGLSVSPDGSKFVSCGFDGILLWETGKATPLASLGYQAGESIPPIRTMEDLKKLKGHTSWVRAVQFSPDGQRIASSGNDTLAMVWDAKSRKVVSRLIGHRSPVASICFAPDGKHIVTGGFDNEAVVFETLTEKVVRRLPPHKAAVISVLWIDDRIMTSSNDTLFVWDAKTGKRLASQKFETRVTCFMPHQQDKAFVGLANGQIREAELK